MVPEIMLKVIDDDDVIEAAGEKSPDGQADFFVSVGNPSTAADDLLLLLLRTDGPKLRNPSLDLERAVPFGLERSEEPRQEFLLTYPGNQESDPEKRPC